MKEIEKERAEKPNQVTAEGRPSSNDGGDRLGTITQWQIMGAMQG